MAWEGSDRRERLPDDWALRRIRVLRRASYRCEHRDANGAPCEAPANQVDHIEHGDNHDEDNLQALCRRHHAIKSSEEGNAARPRQRREPERFPWSL